jgi:hypothetical protein
LGKLKIHIVSLLKKEMTAGLRRKNKKGMATSESGQ